MVPVMAPRSLAHATISARETPLLSRRSKDRPGGDVAVDDDRDELPADDRPPICPACGVTMGIVMDELEATRNVCLECGFADGV